MAKQRKVTALALGVIMSVSVVNVQPAWAAPNQGIHNRLDQIQEKKAKAAQEVDKLEDEIAAAKKRMSEIQASKKQTLAKVNALKQNIIETQKRIQRREELLKERVRVMYKNGSTVRYIEVLLGSESFSDFLSRVFALNLIVEQDKKLLEAQKADKKQLEADKEKIMASLNKLQNQLDSLQEVQNELKEKKQRKMAFVAQLQQKENEIKRNLRSGQEQTGSNSPAGGAGGSNGSANHNQPTAGSSTGGEATGTVNDIVQASRKYFGNSVYVFGGGRTQAQIANGIFDCSGYVHWAFQQIGVNVGWSTSALQYAGHQVDPSNMKPGDLVFFDTYKHNGHVGIYIGGGRFIGAQSSTGVAIASMNSSYWQTHFHGYVRRILD